MAKGDSEMIVIWSKFDITNNLFEVKSAKYYLTVDVEEYGISLEIDGYQEPCITQKG